MTRGVWVVLVALPVVFWTAITSIVSGQEPEMDHLQRATQEVASLAYWIGTSFRPVDHQGTIRTGDVQADVLELRDDHGIRMGVTYQLSNRAALWGESNFWLVRRESVVQIGPVEQTNRSIEKHGDVALGLRYRVNPDDQSDPLMGVSASTDKRWRADLSVARVLDPVLLSLSFRYNSVPVHRFSDLTRGTLDVLAGYGLVANDRVTVNVSVQYGMPIGMKAVRSSTVTMRWNWATDPMRRDSLGLWVAMGQAGRQGSMTFGIEWNGHFSWEGIP